MSDLNDMETLMVLWRSEQQRASQLERELEEISGLAEELCDQMGARREDTTIEGRLLRVLDRLKAKREAGVKAV